ncbi:hypothetical protein [Marinobacterium arenosum]|uniref:hypothetical protein n=1 Tax=Marinobacterium arenosum TaxID=2862496 RepID=UPI001C9854A9|nr:hypothetical protein [Marinobacterium arenosum]MBY4677300.1 hypothetical protein [Marinobacterium arenosum]
MPYQIEQDHDRIITVTYQGQVDLAERMAAVEDACRYIDDIDRVLLLIDVREVIVKMSLEQQKTFGTYLANRQELSRAKVAVLHPAGRNPNQVIDGYAYINGYHLVEFSDTREARAWLLGQLR